MGDDDVTARPDAPELARRIERLQRRMRWEDRSGIALMIGLPLGAAAFLVAYNSGLHVLATAIVALTILFGFVTTIIWMVSGFRALSAFAVFERRPGKRPALWRYLVPIGVALTYGVGFLVFPQYSRWLWNLFIIIGVVGFVAMEVQRRRSGSRHRKRTAMRRGGNGH